MRIGEVHIENYRSIEMQTVRFEALTAVVGANGAGKSTLLSALGLFYNLSAQVTEHDYFNRDTRLRIRIQVTFLDLTPDERREFGSYVHDNSLTVAKIITTGGATYRGARRQIREFAEIRSMGFREAQARLRVLAENPRFQNLAATARSQAALNTVLDDYEAANDNLCELVESESSFLGPTNIGGGSLDKFTKFVRIPAVRDAASEMDRKGAILQLLEVLVLRSVAARPEVRALNEELERKIREIYSRENLVELDALAAQISGLLQRYAPGATLQLEFGAIQVPKLPTPPAVAALTEDQFSCPISHTGHGLQRALIFALLEQLAITEAAAVQDEEDAALENEPNPRLDPLAPPSLILAIEEPELYLHPSRSRYLARTLFALSRNQAPTTQVAYTTHSPFYVGLDRFDCVRLTRKSFSSRPPVKSSEFKSYTRAAAAREIERVNEMREGQFTAESFAIRAAPIMSSIVNEGFFASVVVVVEGLSDASVLTTLQDLLSLEWDEKGIVVIPAVGKGCIDRPVVVFRGFEIPTFFVFDGDQGCHRNDRENTIKANRALLRLGGADVVDFPPTQVTRSFANFAEDIEVELRSVDAEFYDRERSALAALHGYTSTKQANKNPELVSLYVRRAHENGKIPESLFRTARAITELS